MLFLIRVKSNRWRELLFNHPKDVDKPLFQSTAKESKKEQRRIIRENFTQLERRHGVPLGRLSRLESLEVETAFIFVRDANDPSKFVRSRFPPEHRVYPCGTSMCRARRVSTVLTAAIADHEYDNLRWWIEDNVRYGSIIVYPSEDILCRHDPIGSPGSVADRLRMYFLRRRVPGGADYLVFVRRTDPGVVPDHGAYVRQLMVFVREELLTARHDVCVIFDVGDDAGVMEIDSETDETAAVVSIEIYSGTKPEYMPISCVAVHLELKLS